MRTVGIGLVAVGALTLAYQGLTAVAPGSDPLGPARGGGPAAVLGGIAATAGLLVLAAGGRREDEEPG